MRHQGPKKFAGVVALVVAMTGAGAIPAGAASTPAGNTPAAAAAGSAWTLSRSASGWELRWQGDTLLPIGGEALTVRQNGTTLGTAREVGTDAVLELSAPPRSLAGLELWRGDLRVDTGGAQRNANRPAFEEPNDVVPPPPPGLPDPGTPGPYDTERFEYDLTGLPWREYPAPIEVLGEVTMPVDGPGDAPLVLILHGRHSTCYQGGPDGTSSGDWPCPEDWLPIPSHAGYHAIADLLASQGYMVVSISANGINGQDFASPDGGAAARSELIRHHLRLWADWTANGTDPWGGRMRGAVDMDRVVLIGHSRGGEGVARAAIDSRASDPWRIRGLIPIGPTAFGAQTPNNVPMLVILPYCDGDVSDLQGQAYVDLGRDLLRQDPALRSALLVRGANHNFFNSEWTPGQAAAPSWDDWWDPSDRTCGSNGPNRLSPESQQRVGATYSAALVRYALERDNRMRYYLDGELRAPASADNAIVRVSALGSDRLLLHRATPDAVPTGSAGIAVDWCAGWQLDAETPCSQQTTQPHGATPHWGWGGAGFLGADHILWNRGGTVRFGLDRPVDLRGRTRLDLRIALGGNTDSTDARLRVIDADGNAATLRTFPRPTYRMAGSPSFAMLWGRTVRGDLDGVTGVDLSRVVAVKLLLTGKGEAFVFDLAARGRALPTVPSRFLPVASVDEVEVEEGGPGTRTVVIPVRIDQDVTSPVSYWLQTDGQFSPTFRTITFKPGKRVVNVRVRYEGDDAPFGDRRVQVAIYAKRGGLTGNYLGGALVRDDDVAPEVRLDSREVSGTEATGLSIGVSIDAPVAYDIYVQAQFVAPEGTLPEVQAGDIPAETWQNWGWFEPPEPTVKLSESFAFLVMMIPAGSTHTSFDIAFKTDDGPEGSESLALQVFGGLGDPIGTAQGTVTD